MFYLFLPKSSYLLIFFLPFLKNKGKKRTLVIILRGWQYVTVHLLAVDRKGRSLLAVQYQHKDYSTLTRLSKCTWSEWNCQGENIGKYQKTCRRRTWTSEKHHFFFSSSYFWCFSFFLIALYVSNVTHQKTLLKNTIDCCSVYLLVYLFASSDF